MSRGYPDFKLNPGNYGQFSSDNSELAVRLGSPDIFERRGRVLWFDDMQNGLSKYLVGGGATTYHEAVLQYGFLNGVTFRLAPAPAMGDYPGLVWSVPVFTYTKLGIEFLIRSVQIGVTTPTWISLRITYFDGVSYYNFSVEIRFDLGYLQVYSYAPPGPNYFKVLTPNYPMQNQTTDISYNYFKMVIDLANKTYDRLVYNQQGVDLSAYTSQAVPSPTRTRIDFIYTVHPNTTANPIDLCNPIVTIDEP
jgi:hypothetical protein